MADTQVYGTMCTDIGNAAIANSVLTGTKVNFAQIVVGDGNGTPYVPVSGQTALKHQVWSGAIAEVTQDPQQANRMILHAVLPSSVGGWVMREIGVLDDKGQLLAVGNTPEIPKEVVTSGAIMEMDLYIYISVVDARGVNVIIDPTVIIATKADINKLWDTVNKLAQSVKLGDNVFTAKQGVITIPAADSMHDGYMAKEQAGQLAQAVPNTRKLNGHALTGDVTLTASDVGARPSDWSPDLSEYQLKSKNPTAGLSNSPSPTAEYAACFGNGNIMNGGYWNFIGGGNSNEISASRGPYSNDMGACAIIGGRGNRIVDEYGGNCNIILGGASNSISRRGTGNIILGGIYNISAGYNQVVSGSYNKDPSATNVDDYAMTNDAFIVGNGTSDTARSNCFRVKFNGSVYGLSAFNSSGADYSEFFEWQDENPKKEDRIGKLVTLDGEKIRYAKPDDDILGIVSALPAIIGDSPADSWKERYVTDVFGRRQTEEVTIPAQIEEKDKNGVVTKIAVPEHTEIRFKVNPAYDPTKEDKYENREKRPEWSTVGMLGKLVLIDDGTCTVNGYAQPAATGDGTATVSTGKTNCRVMARLDSTHIKVLLK
ncbi:MAG: hypothetical protein E7572_11800 [Ruminococcaceae bacterium]|nr:hypothetical protein [Oscillospiraceae bacterium]